MVTDTQGDLYTTHKSEIEEFKSNSDGKNGINRFWNKVQKMMTADLRAEVRSKKVSLKLIFTLEDQNLYRFSLTKSSKQLKVFLNNFYILQDEKYKRGR